jgi:bacteriocin biosynthesis cyclodehydratase domain-containing protein
VLDATAWIGPLVLPGRTACLRCVDAHRRDRDPAWPAVAAQLAAPPPGGSPGPDGALAAAAAAHAALAALDHLDATALGELAELAGAALVLRLPGGLPRRLAWPPHGACGCHWDRGAATMSR